VLDEDAKHALEVLPVEDQEPVETLAPDGTGEALGDRIRLRRSDRRADYRDAFAVEYLVEGGAELAVVIVDQKRIRSRRPVKLRLRAC
jgi:hypothetical protein